MDELLTREKKEKNADLAIVSSREELQGGEAVDFDGFNLVGCRVHLRHDDVSTVLVLLAQFLPDWGQLLAVAAPGGILCAKTKALEQKGNKHAEKNPHSNQEKKISLLLICSCYIITSSLK